MAPFKSKQVFSVDHGSNKGLQSAMSTPSYIPPAVHRPAETPKVAPPKPKVQSSGVSARNAAYGKAMDKAYSSAKIIGKGVGY